MKRVGASRPGIDRSLLEIRALVEQALGDFAEFSCGHEDLDDFIRSDALRLHALNVARTYVAHYESGGCGYVALMADAVVLKPNERKKIRDGAGNMLTFDDHPVVPALKIARLAVSKPLSEKCRGTGEALVRFAFLTALDLAESVGCRLLTVDAYADAIDFYGKLGFVFNRDETYADRQNPSMRLDLFAATPPPWL